MYSFIANPNARTGAGLKLWEAVEKILIERGVEYQVYLTQYQEHAYDVAKELTQDGKEHTIIALGGDGTVNEVINGIQNPSKVTFGYIPTGSGNDFARGLSIPADVKTAVDNILNPTNVIPFDIGVVEFRDKKRRFVVSSGIGFDADVCHSVLTSPVKSLLNRLKLGKFTYTVVALQRILAMKPYRMVLEIDHNKTVVYDKVYFTATQNLPYEGGGFKFCPKATGDDDTFDVVVAEGFGKLKVLMILPLAYFGLHTKFKGVHLFKCKKLHIKCQQNGPLHTDGEILFAHPEVSYYIEPEKLNLIAAPKK